MAQKEVNYVPDDRRNCCYNILVFIIIGEIMRAGRLRTLWIVGLLGLRKKKKKIQSVHFTSCSFREPRAVHLFGRSGKAINYSYVDILLPYLLILFCRMRMHGLPTEIINRTSGAHIRYVIVCVRVIVVLIVFIVIDNTIYRIMCVRTPWW